MSFEIKKISGKHLNRYLLIDSDTGTEAEIVPALGAILNAFKIQKNSEVINVISGYAYEDEFLQPEKAFKSAKLSPFVCRLKNATYNWEGKSYTIKKFLLGASAIHGLIYDVHFEVIHQIQTEESAILGLSYNYDGSDPGYPFPYNCMVEYTLEKDNTLSISTTVIHHGEKNIPIADGWHPYFTFGGMVDDLRLQISSSEMLEYNDELVPTGKILPNTDFITVSSLGKRKIDNGFVLDFNRPQPLCILRDETKKLQLEIYPDTSYPFLQVYTPDDRHSIAIENLSSAPDAFNNRMGLIVLKPGEEKRFVTRYKVTFV